MGHPYQHNGADFYDLFGPVERSRRGDSLIALTTRPDLRPPAAARYIASGGLLHGPRATAGRTERAGPKTIVSLEAGAKYTNTRKALGGVDHEKGIQWHALADLDYSPGDEPPSRRFLAGSITAFPYRIPNSSVWFYANAGTAWGRRDHPLAAFYFGSFRNNYVDDRPESDTARWRASRFRDRRNHREAVRPIDGRSKPSAPPFRRIGTPAFFLSYIRPAIFAGRMATDEPTDRPTIMRMSALSWISISPSRCACQWCFRSALPAAGAMAITARRNFSPPEDPLTRGWPFTDAAHWALALLPVLIMLAIFIWLDAFALMSFSR